MGSRNPGYVDAGFADTPITSISSDLKRYQAISIAILSRGFDYNISTRTCRRQLKCQLIDDIVTETIYALLLGALLLTSQGLGIPTEQIILNIPG